MCALTLHDEIIRNAKYLCDAVCYVRILPWVVVSIYNLFVNLVRFSKVTCESLVGFGLKNCLVVRTGVTLVFLTRNDVLVDLSGVQVAVLSRYEIAAFRRTDRATDRHLVFIFIELKVN